MSGYTSDAFVTNHINFALSRKRLRTTFKISKRGLRLIKVLFNVGCIHNYILFKRPINKQTHNLFIRFTILFYKGKPFFRGVRLVTKPSLKYNISLKALQVIDSTLRASIFILSTSKGIITHHEAIRYKIGGLLLCVLS